MLHFVTVNHGNFCGRGHEYVNVLFDAIRRNLDDGTEGRFTVFTDDINGYADGITARPLPENLTGWFGKLFLFKDNLFRRGDRIVCLDLDTLITGPLDAIAAYTGPFSILRDFYRPDGLQSAVMAWEAGTNTEIWASYEAAGCPQNVTGGDQAWIERTHLETAVRLQDAFPDAFVSYKQITGPPAKASVCCFHGKPRPHEVLTGWVPMVWRVGGLSRMELTAVCNTEAEKVAANVRSAIARDLDWFDFDGKALPEGEDHVVIVGGGPSLTSQLDEIKWRHDLGQAVWALNNTPTTLQKTDVFFQAHVMLDARPENGNFIPGIRLAGTEFLLASQCAPEVFDRLRGKFITIWHPHIAGMEELLKGHDDKPQHLIGGGTTVGMLAISLAYLRGYRKIHLYGFDSCYSGDEHHAYPQALNDGEKTVEAMFNGKTYKCAPWMVGQANEFQELAAYLMGEGCIITAHGSGLLPEICWDMQRNPPMSPAQQRAAEVLKRIEHIEKPCGVEVGVFTGKMSVALLRGHPGLSLHMVDSWEGQGAAYTGDSGDWHAGLTQEEQDGFLQQTREAVAFSGERAIIRRGRSVYEACRTKNALLDFVFLDADHSYAGCKADIEAWLPKIKPGGWLCGHDFLNADFPKFGVTDAVKEFVSSVGGNVELGLNYTWFIRVPSNG